MFACLLVHCAFAVAAEPAAAVSREVRKFEFRLSGKSEWAWGTQEREPQKFETFFLPEIRVRLFPNLRFTVLGRLRGDAYDRLQSGSPRQLEISPYSRRLLIGDRADAELREFYFQAAVGSTQLTIGKQQIVWGQADGLKVLDVVNPQDFREFILDDFEDSRIPLWAVNAEIPFGSHGLQLIWIPERSYHRLPGRNSSYDFRSPQFTPVPPPGFTLELGPLVRPGRFFADSEGGAKLWSFWKGWDLTLNYLYHYSDFPVPFRQLSLQKRRITLTSRYQRSQLVGGTFSNAFGPVVFRGELGLFLNRFFPTEEPADTDGVVETDELIYMIGLDWSSAPKTLLSLQIFQSWIGDRDVELGRGRLKTDATLLVQRELLEKLNWETLWMLNLNQGDGLIRPKLNYELQDRLKIWIGYDLFYGDRRGLFGQFDQNDRLLLGFKWGL